MAILRLRRAAAKYFRVLICLEPGLQGAIAGSSIFALTMKESISNPNNLDDLVPAVNNEACRAFRLKESLVKLFNGLRRA